MLLTKVWRPANTSSIWLDVGARVPFDGSSSGACFLAALPDAALPGIVEEANGDRDLTLDRAEEVRADAYAQLIERAFVITDPASYFAQNINAVSTPFHPRELAEPVVFTCGASPNDLSVERMETEVGPLLHRAVRELETTLGYRPAPIRR